MDVIRFGPTALPGAGFLALLFHAERVLPYGKAKDAASLSQIERGIRRRSGQWIRGGSGLSRAAAATANAELERLGLVRRTRRKSAKRGDEPTQYEICWARLKRFLRESVRHVAESRVDKGADDTRVQQEGSPPCPAARHPVSSHETHSVEVTSSTGLQGESQAVCVVSNIVAEPSLPVGKEAQPERSLKFFEADDETLRATEHQGSAAVFLQRLQTRHNGTVDAKRVLQDVKEELEEGQVDLSEFLAEDLKVTTGKLKNPHGHYRALARKIVRAHQVKVKEHPDRGPATDCRPRIHPTDLLQRRLP